MTGWRDRVPRHDTEPEMQVRKVLDGLKIPYISQFRVGTEEGPICVADFYLPSARTVVFVDGARWHRSKRAADKRRWQKQQMAKLGLCTVEIPEEVARDKFTLTAFFKRFIAEEAWR